MHRPVLNAAFQPQQWIHDDAVDSGPVQRFDAGPSVVGMTGPVLAYALAESQSEYGGDLDAVAQGAGLVGDGGHSGPYCVRIEADDLTRFLDSLGWDGEASDESLAALRETYEALPPAPDDARERVVGYQILNAEGVNVHGDEDDPFGLDSFDVLCGKAVEDAREWASRHDGYTVAPVMGDDVEEPTFVCEVRPNPSLSP